MNKYKIYLKGGQTIEITASKVDVHYGNLGNISRIIWYNSNKTIKYLNPADVSSIVED